MNKDSSYLSIVKRFLILLALLIVTPVTLNLAFKAFKIYKHFPKQLISYTLLFFGIVFAIYTLYFGLLTVKKLLNTLFK